MLNSTLIEQTQKTHQWSWWFGFAFRVEWTELIIHHPSWSLFHTIRKSVKRKLRIMLFICCKIYLNITTVTYSNNFISLPQFLLFIFIWPTIYPAFCSLHVQSVQCHYRLDNKLVVCTYVYYSYLNVSKLDMWNK